MWCWIIPMGSMWSCVTPRLGTPIWGCTHQKHSSGGVASGWQVKVLETNKAGVHNQPHPLKSPCLPPGDVFGYFPALDPAKPHPAFLHSSFWKQVTRLVLHHFGWAVREFQGLQLEHSLPSKWSRHQGTSWDSPCRMFSCLLCCPRACQSGTVPASLLPTPCHWQPSQCYCHGTPTSCYIFTHSFMEVSVIRLHCGLSG